MEHINTYWEHQDSKLCHLSVDSQYCISVYCVLSRLYVLHRLPNLKFLDSTEVSEEEQKEAKRVGQFMKVVKPSDSQVKVACSAGLLIGTCNYVRT